MFTDNNSGIQWVTMGDMERLLDDNRALEAKLTRQMEENDDLRSCIKALNATVEELQRIVKEMGR